MDYKLSDELMDLASGLVEVYEMAYQLVKPKVDYIIKNNIRDIKIIDKIFDELLNVPTDKGYELFVELCSYVSQFNRKIVEEYVAIYKDLYGDEEIDDSMVKQ